jgi:hypothetical protein
MIITMLFLQTEYSIPTRFCSNGMDFDCIINLCNSEVLFCFLKEKGVSSTDMINSSMRRTIPAQSNMMVQTYNPICREKE